MKWFCTAFIFLLLIVATGALAQSDEPEVPDTVAVELEPPPAPVTGLEAFDTDDDHGHSVTITWDLSADDGQGENTVMSYEVFRWVPEAMAILDSMRGNLSGIKANISEADNVTGEMYQQRADAQAEIEKRIEELTAAHAAYPRYGAWTFVGKVVAGSNKYVNSGSKDRHSGDFLPDYTDFYFMVEAVAADSNVRAASEVMGPVQSSGQFFNKGRYPVFFAILIFGILTIYFVQRARTGADLYVRPLAGIEAVDDAIGRATEMGRPILYILGLGTASDVATIASFTILGRVAKQVAEYQTSLMVPTYDPIVMSVAQEVVKSAYLDAGRPDDYDENTVNFVTNLQFAYVAAVNGMMLRELPATNIYMGKFFAESLILAETGALAGSIQIAGTDEIAQIPFFIVACDYTLIGEELYAASAYLSREPILLGSLKAQDWAKAALIVLAIVGLLAANMDWPAFTSLFKVTN